MDAAFVGKCGSSDIRLIYRHIHIGHFTDITGSVGQLRQGITRNTVIAHLKLERRDD
ncbi:hypothetical protein D3C80_2023970 [compost metagenome]